MYAYSNTSRFVLGRLVNTGTGSPQRCSYSWCREKKIEINVSRSSKNGLLTLPVLTFLCNRFSKILKFTLQNTFLQSSKFTSPLSNCRGFCKRKSVFSLTLIEKLLLRQNFLNIYVINKKTNIKTKKVFFFRHFLIKFP